LVDRFYEYARENLEELKIWKDDQDGIHVSFAEKLACDKVTSGLSSGDYDSTKKLTVPD